MTRKTNWTCGIVLAGLVALAGCSKSGSVAPKTQKVNGVDVDIPKLQEAFASTTSVEIKDDISQVSFGIRYGDYMKTLAALDKLSKDPSLTDPQKKIVGDVLEQMKQVINQAPPKPGQ